MGLGRNNAETDEIVNGLGISSF
jgi:hypothetical protein